MQISKNFNLWMHFKEHMLYCVKFVLELKLVNIRIIKYIYTYICISFSTLKIFTYFYLQMHFTQRVLHCIKCVWKLKLADIHTIEKLYGF